MNLSRTIEEKDGFITDIQRIGRFGTVRIDRIPDTGENTGFRTQGSGHRVEDTGFRTQGSGHRIQDAGFRIQGFQIQVRIQGSGHRV